MSFMPDFVTQTLGYEVHALARTLNLEPEYAAHWKAEGSNGGRATIQIGAARVHIAVDGSQAPLVGFNEAELHKRLGVYAGTAKASRPCPKSAGSLCTAEAPIELIFISHSRIEGRVGNFGPIAKVSCNNCPPKEPVWRKLSWTPE
jgi:hypothetical protein